MGNKQSAKLNKLFSRFIKAQNKANCLWSKIRDEINKLPVDNKLWLELETSCLMHTEPAGYVEQVKEIISRVRKNLCDQ